jgi:hypothetical protein
VPAKVGAALPDGQTVSIVRFVPDESGSTRRPALSAPCSRTPDIARPPVQDIDEFDVVVSPEQIGKGRR